jgi:hypothetical protein
MDSKDIFIKPRNIVEDSYVNIFLVFFFMTICITYLFIEYNNRRHLRLNRSKY